MSIIRITKEFHFEMAHALYGYNGPCKNIHGHSYSLSLTVIGKVIENNSDPKNGMVIDFSDIKQIVQSKIINELDHALVLNALSPHREFANRDGAFEKIILVDYQPTCENLLIDIASKIKASLPIKVQLHHVHLRETPSSFAEWHSEDN